MPGRLDQKIRVIARGLLSTARNAGAFDGLQEVKVRRAFIRKTQTILHRPGAEKKLRNAVSSYGFVTELATFCILRATVDAQVRQRSRMSSVENRTNLLLYFYPAYARLWPTDEWLRRGCVSFEDEHADYRPIFTKWSRTMRILDHDRGSHNACIRT